MLNVCLFCRHGDVTMHQIGYSSTGCVTERGSRSLKLKKLRKKIYFLSAAHYIFFALHFLHDQPSESPCVALIAGGISLLSPQSSFKSFQTGLKVQDRFGHRFDHKLLQTDLRLPLIRDRSVKRSHRLV